MATRWKLPSSYSPICTKNCAQVRALIIWALKFRRAVQNGIPHEQIIAELGDPPVVDDTAFSNSGTGGSARPAGSAPLSMRKGANKDGSFGHVVVLCNGQKITSEGNQRLQEMTRQGHVITYFVDVGTFFADDKESVSEFAKIASVSEADMMTTMICLGRFVCRKFTYICPIVKKRIQPSNDAANSAPSTTGYSIDDLMDDEVSPNAVWLLATTNTSSSVTKDDDSRLSQTERRPCSSSRLAEPDTSPAETQNHSKKRSKSKPPPESYLPELIGEGAEDSLIKYGFNGDFLNSGHFRFDLTPWLSIKEELQMERLFSTGTMTDCKIVYVDAASKNPLEVPLPTQICQRIVANKASYNIIMACHEFVSKDYYMAYTSKPLAVEHGTTLEEESEEKANAPIRVAAPPGKYELSDGLTKMNEINAFANYSSAKRFMGESLSMIAESLHSHPLRDETCGAILQVYGVVTTTARSDLHGAMNYSNAAVLGLIEPSATRDEFPLIKRMRVTKRSDIDTTTVRLFLLNVLLIRCTGCPAMLTLFCVVLAHPEMRTGKWADLDLSKIPPFGIPSLLDEDMRKLHRDIVQSTFVDGKCTMWVLNQHKNELPRRFSKGYGGAFVDFLGHHVAEFADKFIEWCDKLFFLPSEEQTESSPPVNLYDAMIDEMDKYLRTIDNGPDMGFLAQAVFNDI